MNVRRGHARSPHTNRGFAKINSTPSVCGMSLTRCRRHACTRSDTTPQSEQPSETLSACVITRQPQDGRSTASIT